MCVRRVCYSSAGTDSSAVGGRGRVPERCKEPYPRPNLRNIVNYCIISHNIAQYREISRTRQPRPRPKGHVRGKRPLINTPYENSRPRTLVTLDQAVNWPRLTAWPGCGRKIHSCSPALQLLGQNRQISPDIARYRVISHREISRRRYCERLWDMARVGM